MKISGFMLVHNAEKSIRYTLDYYLNHHKLDTIFIVDWGSFDKTPSILASYQDKNVLTTSIKIQFFDQLPEITSYILKELFLKFDNTWVIPLVEFHRNSPLSFRIIPHFFR